MTEMKRSKALGKTEAAAFLLCLAIGAAVIWYIHSAALPPSREAIVRAGVGRDLLVGVSRGRQGLVGSLYYGPLPTLLALPLLNLPAPFGDCFALVIVSLISVAFLGACICAWLRQCGIAVLTRLGIALAVCCSPVVLGEMLRGTSAPLFMALIFLALCFLMHWWRTDALRSLAYLALVIALAMITNYQAVALSAVIGAFLVIHVTQRRRGRSYAEATLIVFLLPSLYVAALWIISNWLIMGDPFFFMRGLANTTGAPDHVKSLLTDGCPWLPVLLLCVVGMCGHAAAAVKMPRVRRFAGLAILVAAGIMFWPEEAGQLGTQSGPVTASSELPEVLGDFDKAFGSEWLIVAGHRGYEVTRTAAPKIPYVYHTLSLYPALMLERTRGKRAYLLVPAPEGADRWEDINLKFPAAFDEPPPFAVYQRTWRHWRLWRVVRMDETDRK